MKRFIVWKIFIELAQFAMQSSKMAKSSRTKLLIYDTITVTVAFCRNHDGEQVSISVAVEAPVEAKIDTARDSPE